MQGSPANAKLFGRGGDVALRWGERLHDQFFLSLRSMGQLRRARIRIHGRAVSDDEKRAAIGFHRRNVQQPALSASRMGRMPNAHSPTRIEVRRGGWKFERRDELSAGGLGCGNDLAEALITVQRIPAWIEAQIPQGD